MKKKILVILLSSILVFSCTGCDTTYQEATANITEDFAGGYFTIIKKWRDDATRYYIVFANDTKVKYLIAIDADSYGITPLYNADGSLQVYENVSE